jgi:hypothetical protein
MITGNQARQVARRTAAAAALLLMGASAALADPPGYLFQDFDQPSRAEVAESAAQSASDPQIAAVNQKAEHALAAAREALREIQQTTRTAW